MADNEELDALRTVGDGDVDNADDDVIPNDAPETTVNLEFEEAKAQVTAIGNGVTKAQAGAAARKFFEGKADSRYVIRFATRGGETVVIVRER